jgi:hypothetical protein
MKYLFKIILTVFTFSIFLYGCYNNSEEYLYPTINTDCDTTNVTYSATISSIISETCLSCHQGGSAGGGIDLSNYANVKAQVDKGRLLGSIQQLSGYSAMPKGAAKLSDCKINQINIWINKGTQNN